MKYIYVVDDAQRLQGVAAPAYAARPKMLLLDEPSSGIAPKCVTKSLDAIPSWSTSRACQHNPKPCSLVEALKPGSMRAFFYQSFSG